MIEGTYAIFAGAIGLGLLHGVEPGHGWLLATAYAMGRARPFAVGLGASIILGVGHLASSIAVVLVFFAFKEWFELGELWWMNTAAGALLIGLGLWELRHRHGHGHDHHRHGHPGHEHGEPHQRNGGNGLWRIAGAAFVLGFAHQEEFEIIGLCAGSEFCLEIMVVYALAVILAIVALTLLMIAGYRRLEGRLEHVARHLPKFSGAILIAMGAGFIAGIL